MAIANITNNILTDSGVTTGSLVPNTLTISTTSPLTGGGALSGNLTLAIPAATTSVNGYLTSTDWNTFNSKQSALTNPVTGTGTSGQVTYFNGTSTVTGSNNLNFDGTNLTIGNPSSTLAQLHVYNSSAAASMLLQTNSSTDYGEIAVRNNASTATSYFRQYSTAAPGSDFGISRAGLALFFSNYATNFAVGTRNGGDLILGTADTERARLLASNGYFGIGTSSPSYLLDVNGTGRFSGQLTAASFYGSGTGTSSINGHFEVLNGKNLYLYNTGSSTYWWMRNNANTFELNYGASLTPLTIASTGAATFSSSVTAGASFLANTASVVNYALGSNGANFGQIYPNGSTAWSLGYGGSSSTFGTAVLTWTSGGNVGIGTTSPNALLQVNGSSIIGSGTISNGTTFGGGNQINRLKVESGAYTCLEINGATSGASIQFTYGANAPNQVSGLIGYNYASGAANEMWISNALSGILGFATNNTERMRITSGGELCLNTSSPITSGLFSLQGASATYNLLTIKDTGTTYSSSNNFYLYFVNSSNGGAGGVSHNSASTVNFYTGPSDFRLKKNINKWSENVIDLFKEANPVTYELLNDNDGKIHKGYIAQEMVDKFPEAYGKDKDGYYTYIPDGFIPYLVKAIQELKQEIDELKNK